MSAAEGKFKAGEAVPRVFFVAGSSAAPQRSKTLQPKLFPSFITSHIIRLKPYRSVEFVFDSP